MSMTEIPDAAVEAAAEAYMSGETGESIWHHDDTEAETRRRVRVLLEAAAPHIFERGYEDGVQATTDALLAFAEDRDKALGSIRSHITTYELRKLVGVADD